MVIGRTGTWVRWGWLAITAVLALALIIASWANYRSARQATTTLHLGQGGILEGAVRQLLRTSHGEVSQQDLADFLRQHQDDGLRYVALIGEQGQTTMSAGDPAPAPMEDPRRAGGSTGPGIAGVDGRVRMFLTRPPSRAAEAAEPKRPRPTRTHHGAIIEFEPLIATQLLEKAANSLGFGLAAAASMMLAAFIFWRMSQSQERAQRRLEHERRLSLLGEMSAVLAHEIRNPLASLKGHAQLLAERLAPESGERRKADRIILEASRLENLTTDLLDFVRSGPLQVQEASPVELLRESIDEVAAGFCDIDATGAPESWPLDAGRMRQALTNLLRNARQASPAGSHPSAQIAVEDVRLIMTIRDHGAGLPKGEEERIFDPFFTKQASGTGLGLAVARRVVELHGGRLTAVNHAGGGAIFRIELPWPKG
jgi:two-component system sensor histidine kinase HydH